MSDMTRPTPLPSEVGDADAPSYGEAHWMAACDYWQTQAANEKRLFRRLPVIGGVRPETLARLRGWLAGQDAAAGAAGAEAAKGPLSKAAYWHHRALYYEERARAYGSVNERFGRFPLSLVNRLWDITVIRARLGRTQRLMERLSSADCVKGRRGGELVSVVTPTFNRAYCLGRAINSLACQTYGEWELIVVDDGSTDGTEALMAGYTDDRIVYRRIPKSGVSRARNVGLDMAKGRFITFMDSDNVLDPGFIGEMATALSNEDASVGFAYCDCDVYVDGLYEETFSEELTPGAMLERPLIDLGTVMCRREVFGQGARFSEEMDRWVDYELLLRVHAAWQGVHVKKTLMHYFRLDDGISQALDTMRDMEKNATLINRTKDACRALGGR